MRSKLLLGLAGVAAAAAAVHGQAPPPPAANTPVLPQTAPAAHPWYVQPAQGAWMLCVKSYSGPVAKGLAEELAKEIRNTYGVPAYLFEKGSEDKKKQAEFVAEEKKRQMAEQQKFLQFADDQRKKAEVDGMQFLESAPKVRVPRYQSIDEQWAVLIGGWKDMETARKELEKVRGWPPPKNPELMDRAMVVRQQGGKTSGEAAAINPFQFALVVPNPVAEKNFETDTLDPALVRLNAKEELSLLQITKPYTLAVKSFHPFRRRVEGKDAEKTVFQKVFGADTSGEEMQAMAQQAVEFAKALRNPKFRPRPLESYVLHTLYGSVVCVGQYDAPEDPAMVAAKAELDAIRFEVKRQDSYETKTNVKLFDPMFAMKVPRPAATK